MKTLSQLQKIIKQAQGTVGTTAYRPKGGDEQKFMDKHIIQHTDDANGNDDAMFKGTGVKTVDREKERHGYDAEKGAAVHEETQEVDERTLSTGEMKKREDIVKGMKKGLKGFKARYGKDAKSVMYATATKLAKEETEEEYDVQILELFAGLDEENRQFMLEMLDKGLEKEILEYIKESEAE